MSNKPETPSDLYDYFDLLGQGANKSRPIEENKEDISTKVNDGALSPPIRTDKICEL